MRIDAFSRWFFRKMFIVATEVFCFGGVVEGDRDGLVGDTDMTI